MLQMARRISPLGRNLTPVTAGGGFTPSSIAGLKLWLKSESGVYVDAGSTLATNGQTVQQWNNSYGSVGNAAQATSGNRPTFVSSGMNSLPSIRFDGVSGDSTAATPSNYLRIASAGGELSSAATLIVAFEILNSDASYTIFDAYNSDTWWNYANIGGYFGVFRGTRTAGYPGVTPSSGKHIVSLLSGASVYDIIIDDVEYNAYGGDFQAGTDWTIGDSSFAPKASFNGYISEILVYDTVLGSTDRTAVESYLATKFSI